MYRVIPPAAMALAIAMSLTACKRNSDEARESEPAARTGAEQGPPPAPSAREGRSVHRPLLAEAARAEVDIGGLYIDFGTADQHKYTRGGWSTGWADPAGEDPTAGAANFYHAKLDVLAARPIAEVVLRARTELTGQVIEINVEDEKVGSAPIPPESWEVVRIPIDPALPAGRHQLDLTFGKGGKYAERVSIDWMWLAASAGAEPPEELPRVIPVRVGEEPRRALIAPTARSYNFYLQVPEQARLVFDYGAPTDGVTFSVHAHTDGAEPAELFRAAATDQWKEQAVDLTAYAGQPVRLELRTEGDGGGWGEPEILVPAAERPAAGDGRPQNIILLVVDTIRADAFDAFAPAGGKSIASTPAYDAFAAESTVFSNAYNNENWTKPSVATTLTGLYPTTHDTKKDSSKLPDDVDMLPERLKKAGFATAGFVANGYVSNVFGFEQGWDTFRNYIRESRSSEAEHVYGDAVSWLEEQAKSPDQRFFLYLQTIDPHVNYSVDEKYWSQYFEGKYRGFVGSSVSAEDQIALSGGKGDERDAEWLRALYWGEVTYHDEEFGKFLARLEELGLAENTAIIVTNDHGEELGEHGRYGHGHSLYDPMIRAPLTIRFGPRFAAGRRIEEIVEHVDLTPTILDLMGIDPLVDADGTSLMPLVEGGPVRRPFYAISEFLGGSRAIRVGDWKLWQTTTSARLFDLASDPNEDTDLIASRPIARRLTEIHLGEGLGMPSKRQREEGAAHRRKFEAGKANISPAMRRSLEALGYFGDH